MPDLEGWKIIKELRLNEKRRQELQRSNDELSQKGTSNDSSNTLRRYLRGHQWILQFLRP